MYNYTKLKYRCNAKLCCMDSDSFIMRIKTEDIYEDIAEDFEKRFDTWSYVIDRALIICKSKEVIGLIKDDLGQKIMREFIELRPKQYFYLRDDGGGNKKAKGTRKWVIKRILMLEGPKNCLQDNKIKSKLQ